MAKCLSDEEINLGLDGDCDIEAIVLEHTAECEHCRQRYQARAEKRENPAPPEGRLGFKAISRQ